MSAETERLERAAAEEREELASHLENLQNRIERAVDPKMIYERHPLPVLGVVLVAGVVLGAVTQGDGRRRRVRGRTHRILDADQVQSAWGDLRGAMLGMVAARVGDMLYNMVSRSVRLRGERKAGTRVEHAPRRRGEEIVQG